MKQLAHQLQASTLDDKMMAMSAADRPLQVKDEDDTDQEDQQADSASPASSKSGLKFGVDRLLSQDWNGLNHNLNCMYTPNIGLWIFVNS